VTIPFPTNSAFTVKANNTKIAPNQFDDATGKPTPLEKTKCGENRYVGVANFLEFYITPDCEITLKTRETIVSSVRMEWTLQEFYDDGGTTSFIDRLASVLGIDPTRVLIVQVYEGSVCIMYNLLDDDEDENNENFEDKDAIKDNVSKFLTG